MTSEAPRPSDDVDAIASNVREAAERNAKALRDVKIAIEVEPPTVFRP